MDALQKAEKKHTFFVYLLQGYVLVISAFIFFALARSWYIGDTFVHSWRWIHDQILIPVFWYFGPLYILIILLNVWLVRKGRDILRHFHRSIHHFGMILLAMPFTTVFSQVFGGCLWFYFTEGWWDRFVPGWMWKLLGDQYAEPVATILYGVSTVLIFKLMRTYFSRYIEN